MSCPSFRTFRQFPLRFLLFRGLLLTRMLEKVRTIRWTLISMEFRCRTSKKPNIRSQRAQSQVLVVRGYFYHRLTFLGVIRWLRCSKRFPVYDRPFEDPGRGQTSRHSLQDRSTGYFSKLSAHICVFAFSLRSKISGTSLF